MMMLMFMEIDNYLRYAFCITYIKRFMLGSITDIHVFDLQFPLYPR